MTATDQMRAMLDQLMGTSRNGKWRVNTFDIIGFISESAEQIIQK